MTTDTIEKLYPVDQSAKAVAEMIEDALEESGGEITPAIQNMMNGLARIERLGDLVNYYHRLDAEARGKRAEIEPIIAELEADMRHIDARRERVKQWIQQAIPPGPNSSFCTEAVNVFYIESTQCEIVDPEAVPFEFTKVKREPDRMAIKQALKDKKEVAGCTLKINYNLQIKHAGPRSAANKSTRTKKRAEKTVDLASALEG